MTNPTDEGDKNLYNVKVVYIDRTVGRIIDLPKAS